MSAIMDLDDVFVYIMKVAKRMLVMGILARWTPETPSTRRDNAPCNMNRSTDSVLMCNHNKTGKKSILNPNSKKNPYDIIYN